MKSPIGIFDSGYGGLTVLKEIVTLLPAYDYVYLGDNARAPYGPLPFETVYQYTLEGVQQLFHRGCTLVILACNTASAKALRTIQQNDLPYLDPPKKVLGVIRPTAEVIGKYTKTGHAGIMATTGTVESESYCLEVEKFFPKVHITQEACPEWVELVESGAYLSAAADGPVKSHLDTLLAADAKIDCVLLACTHYPLLINKICKYLPPTVTIVEQGVIVAESLKAYLHNHAEIEGECSRGGDRRFYTTGETADFDKHASIFFGCEVRSNQIKQENR